MIKFIVKILFVSLPILFYTLAIFLLFFEEPLFDFLKISIGENFVLNQLKADLGGFCLLVGSIPILWFRTKDDFWVKLLYVSLVFVALARLISFIFDGIHPVTLFLFVGEIILIYLCRYILKYYPEGSFFN